MGQHPVLAHLLANNAQWAEDVEKVQPGFFERCAKGQSPKVLWIGCADSRVPDSVLTVSKPGDIFVHRNIANQVFPSDDNISSVLTYAVMELGVTHILLVGHTHCGGAAACHAAAQALPDDPTTPLARWLAPLTDYARQTGCSVSELEEANVRMQVENLTKSEVLQQAWASGKHVLVHGWIYEIENGQLRDMGITVGK
ncbi:carbonic anhydrase [Laetiporus sulphureus 93-53]|uniref:Carbonic anhydrase n=1 Tax=Laetiporus sulphureus 93-53 TaxID=1314785 RepID=A0A165ERZ8_9APHY|nr:carbonic anhydrase [Laetiporus sulphureus 93-53]KZT07646.1 carbonic anhydrase [Laetiporus sulphureus 93-53]